ncbi:MAG: hypothetical protein AB1736_12370 [Chloroflexota bacterium]
MFKKILPFVLVAIALSVALSVLVATQRMACPYPGLARFLRRSAGLPVESAEMAEPAEAAEAAETETGV